MLKYDLLAGTFIKAPDIGALFNFESYPDHIMRDNMRRQSPVESGILALTWRGFSGYLIPSKP
jgi:hypothetical protein